jgi:hypothetical protein
METGVGKTPCLTRTVAVHDRSLLHRLVALTTVRVRAMLLLAS